MEEGTMNVKTSRNKSGRQRGRQLYHLLSELEVCCSQTTLMAADVSIVALKPKRNLLTSLFLSQLDS